MDIKSLISILYLALMMGLIFGLMLIAYSDGVQFALFKKLRCRLGWHKRRKFKMAKYYCQFCKKPRKKPTLKVIDGGNKMRDTSFKF